MVGGIREPILFNFISNKPPGNKVFCAPETIHYEKIIKSVLIIVTFYLVNDNNEEVDFNEKTLILTLQTIKICFIKRAFKILNVIPFVLEVDTDLLQNTFMLI